VTNCIENDSEDMTSQFGSLQKPTVIVAYTVVAVPVLLLGVLGYFWGQNNGLSYLGLAGNLLLLSSILSWRLISGSFFSLYTLFFLSFFYFSYGQAFLRSIGVQYPAFDLFSLYGTSLISKAELFTILGMFFMHLGALLAHRTPSATLPETDLNTSSQKAVLLVGWVLFVFSAPLYFIHMYASLKTSVRYGYMALYNYGNSSFGTATSSAQNITSSLQLYLIPAVFLLLVAYKDKVVGRRFVSGVILVAVILDFMIGNRTDAGSLLVGFMFFWNSNVKTYTKGRAVGVFFGVLALMVIFNFVGAVRGIHDKSTASVAQTLVKSLSGHNPLFSTIGEMGASMFPLISVIQIVPSIHAYQHGGTYLASLFGVFPNFLFGQIFHRVSLSNWLMIALGMNYGPGFSLLAEAYYNFGWMGDIFMLVLGWGVVRLLYPFKKASTLTNALSTVMLLLLVTTARQDSLLMIRYVVYYTLIPYLLIRFVDWTFSRNLKQADKFADACGRRYN